MFLFVFLLKFIENHKSLDLRITHEKKSYTHEILTRKKLGPTKYPRENILDPRNTHEKNFQTHEGTMARDPRDLDLKLSVNSSIICFFLFFY